MGRHSLPDPDESGSPSEDPQTERFAFGSEGPAARFRADDESEAHDEHPGADLSASDDAADTDHLPAPPRSREWDGGEWTGSHRAVTPGRRGVSVGVIVALITVVVVVGGVILWRFFGDALSTRSDVAAARCVDGEINIAVVVDPAIAEPVQDLAQRYNDNAETVGDRCVQVGITAADSAAVVNGLADQWPAELGERPALWIPASTASEARLEAAAGPQTITDSRSLVTSPVVLAVAPPVRSALAEQTWAALPGLQTDPAGLDGLGLQGWGGLRVALPLDRDSDAAYLAAEAVAAASAPQGAPVSSGLGAVSTLIAGAPDLPDNTAATALDALIDAADPQAASVHAVVTTEQQLFQRAASLPDAASKVAAWRPSGPTAVADFPTVLLSGDWLAQEQLTAASEFARFLRKPEQLGDLANAGFQVTGQESPASDVVDFAPVDTPLEIGDVALRATIADTVTSPIQSPTVTIMLDQSMPAEEGGRSRLANVVDALKARLPVLPPDSGVGLWTFDGVAGRNEVSPGALSEPVDGRARSEALTAALDSQSASGGGAVSFTTLRLVYADASANYRDGQQNSVLVITTGPHTDRTLGGEGLQQYISGAFDPERPVAVNVVDFGDDSDRAAWEGVAQTTGGQYHNLASSDSPELAAVIAVLLG
ncbi:hypothetical protein [Mycobacterium sp. SMC-4]|uniref:hypothetical protein n=1 Tax=Mycobacterium sp. SMC-4 TaxID=2857059 RepID=UPI0021B36A68|nr:hypothetical protein [Mycobacterium sp. SMC-4]UXA15940.1 hypothetical protein KXD98_13750 [Mycobacterium sp. SMC-4]